MITKRIMSSFKAFGFVIFLLYLQTVSIAHAQPKPSLSSVRINTLDELTQKAEGGDAMAQFELGMEYYGQDFQKAYNWCRKAADQGFGQAQMRIGWMYQQGQGVEKNALEAVNWYKKAAEQGDSTAQSLLGKAYLKGQGIAKDEIEAAKWLRNAAEKGESSAQEELGKMYQRGEGIEQDLVEAYMWLKLAMACSPPRNFSRPAEILYKEAEALAMKLSPEQIAEVERRVEEFIDSHKLCHSETRMWPR